MARAENIAFTFLLARTRPPPIFTLTHTHHISNFPNLVVCDVREGRGSLIFYLP